MEPPQFHPSRSDALVVGDEFHGRLVVCDDLDGDGVREFVDVFGPPAMHASTLRVRSGATGKILRLFDPRAVACVEEADARSALPLDLDGDGTEERLCGELSSS